MHSCTCDYGSRALCLRFGFAFKSSPSNHGRDEQSWEIRRCWELTLQCSICWDEHSPPSQGMLNQLLQTHSCNLAQPSVGDHNLSMCGALSEALVGRERQGKRAAASLCQTPAQKARAGLQVKEFQIVVARNSKSSQIEEGLQLRMFGKCCSGETTQLHLSKTNVRFLSLAPALIPQAGWFHSCCTYIIGAKYIFRQSIKLVMTSVVKHVTAHEDLETCCFYPPVLSLKSLNSRAEQTPVTLQSLFLKPKLHPTFGDLNGRDAPSNQLDAGMVN